MLPDMEFVSSISVEAYGYDAETRELYIRFVKSGETYIYDNVDEHVFEALRMADSKGTYVNQVIKINHKFRKL
jgi:hypothetical protein